MVHGSCASSLFLSCGVLQHGAPFALLHTTNLYPTPPHLVRLGAMVQLQTVTAVPSMLAFIVLVVCVRAHVHSFSLPYSFQAFPDAVVGLSDHTTQNFACFGAVALGACVLERHFTDHMQRHPLTHRSSLLDTLLQSPNTCILSGSLALSLSSCPLGCCEPTEGLAQISSTRWTQRHAGATP